MGDERIIVTKRSAYAIPQGRDGMPIEENYPGIKLPGMLQGAKIYQTPAGPVITGPETKDNGNDKAPDKPVVFPSREDGVRRHDDAFYARLAKAYEKVTITAQPMQSFGGPIGDIEKPAVAANEARVLLMRHFPEGPGMAAAAQRAAKRYNAALDERLQNGAAGKPEITGLARRWGIFCHDLGNAQREHYDAGYRPAMVDPDAINFSQVRLGPRDRKAVLNDRGVRRGRGDELER